MILLGWKNRVIKQLRKHNLTTKDYFHIMELNKMSPATCSRPLISLSPGPGDLSQHLEYVLCECSITV